MKVRYSPKARTHLIAIFTYIAERNPRAAARVVARIRFAAEQLGHFPLIGRPGMSPHTYERAVRGLPYIIVYEIHSAPDVVVILGIFHGAQDRPI